MMKPAIVFPVLLIGAGMLAPSVIGYAAYDPWADAIEAENHALCLKFGLPDKKIPDCKADLQELRRNDRLAHF
jgi:hypothetical protein